VGLKCTLQAHGACTSLLPLALSHSEVLWQTVYLISSKSCKLFSKVAGLIKKHPQLNIWLLLAAVLVVLWLVVVAALEVY
jgi:hypothetical protein